MDFSALFFAILIGRLLVVAGLKLRGHTASKLLAEGRGPREALSLKAEGR